MNKILPYLTLFTSFSTLICCALPALFVSIGMGAAVAATVSTIPQLIWISEHKILVFIVAGLLLSLNGAISYLTRNAPCPLDPVLREYCMKGRKISKIILIVSFIFYFIGVFFAFVAPYMF